MTPEEWDVLLLSLRVAVVAILVTLPFGLALAYYLATGRSTGRLVADNLLNLPLVLPPVVTGYLLLLMFSPSGWLAGWIGWTPPLVFTWGAAALAAGIVAFPLLVQTVRVTFEQVDPVWLEAVYVYGGGRWAAFRHVIGPLTARGVAAGIVLAFARAFGEFGATIVVAGNIPGRTQTLPLAIFTRLNQAGGEAAALRLVGIAVGVSVVSLTVHFILTRAFFHRSAD